jgi:hypothetical protein
MSLGTMSANWGRHCVTVDPPGGVTFPLLIVIKSTHHTCIRLVSSHLFFPLLYDKSEIDHKKNRTESHILSVVQNDNTVTLSFCMYRKIWLPSMCLHTYTGVARVGFRSLRNQRF